MKTGQPTPAVVLRTTAVREADLVVVLLTPRRGKLEAIARAARKSRRRFPGGLPAGARGRATIGEGKGTLVELLGFDPVADHAALGRDLDAFAYTAYLCELTDHLLTGSHGDELVFAELCSALERTVAAPAPLVLRRFELRLLDALGFLPTFGQCCVCGAGVAASATPAYDPARGGVLCPAHAGAAAHVDAAVLGACTALLAGEEDPLAGLSGGKRRQLRDLVRNLVRRHLRRPLRSTEFFAQVPGPPGPGRRPRG